MTGTDDEGSADCRRNRGTLADQCEKGDLNGAAKNDGRGGPAKPLRNSRLGNDHAEDKGKRQRRDKERQCIKRALNGGAARGGIHDNGNIAE